MRRQLPHLSILLLSAVLATVVGFLTWPTRGAVFCQQLPELTALAACGAALLVFSFRALASAHGVGEDRRISGGSAILAALALFLSVHFIAQYRKPCAAVQKQMHFIHSGTPSSSSR